MTLQISGTNIFRAGYGAKIEKNVKYDMKLFYQKASQIYLGFCLALNTCNDIKNIVLLKDEIEFTFDQVRVIL
jgi:hypothetical protein